MTTPYRCSDEWHLGDPSRLTTKAGKPKMVNRYPATCTICGVELPPGRGMVGGKGDDGWRWMCPVTEIRLNPIRRQP